MIDKEKQIEEMVNIIENAFKVYFGANDLVEPEDFPYQAKDLAKELLEHYQPKLPQDSVVLSREEYERGIIQIGYIEELEKDKKTYQEINLKLLNKIEELELKLKQERKETVKKIISKMREMLNSCETIYEDDEYLISPNVGYLMKDVDAGLDEIEKQFSIEIKE